jgi:hypothetical protein
MAQHMNNLEQLLYQLAWLVPLTLACLAVWQVLGIIWVSLAPIRRRRSTPVGVVPPIMPTNPTGTMNYAPNPGGYGGGSSAASPAGGAAYGRMMILTGLPQQELRLPSLRFGIGRYRDEPNNILLDLNEGSISRSHAQFRGDLGRREFYLMDVGKKGAGSTYGTYIRMNGQMVQLKPRQEVRLYNEDVVRFGTVVTVRFLLPCETREAAARQTTPATEI